MDLERLIELAARPRRFPVCRISYAQLRATLPITECEMTEALHSVRAPGASPSHVRTTLRRLGRIFPRTNFTRKWVWTEPLARAWRDALRAERKVGMARMTPAELEAAVVLIMGGGPFEGNLRHRLAWAFNTGDPFSMWTIYTDLEGDPAEIAADLIRLDARYLERQAAPEMDRDALVRLVHDWRAQCADEGDQPDRSEMLIGVLDRQLPNARPSELMPAFGKPVDAEQVIDKALRMTRPMHDVYD